MILSNGNNIYIQKLKESHNYENYKRERQQFKKYFREYGEMEEYDKIRHL